MSDVRSLDYLSFSIPDDTHLDAVVQLLGLPFRDIGHKFDHWHEASHAYVGGEMVAGMYRDNDNKFAAKSDSIFFDIRGSGMDVVESSAAFEDWRGLLARLFEVGAVVKRIDPATDNKDGRIELADVKRQVFNGELVKKGKTTWSEHNSFRNDRLHETFNVGSRQSDVMLRIYGKGFQQRELTNWLRFEFELKHKRADNWARFLVSDGWDAAWANLRGLMDFRDRSADKNKSRWPASEWWVNLMGSSRVVRSLGKRAQMSIDATYAYLLKMVAKPFAKVCHAFEGDLSLAYRMLAEGQDRFNNFDRQLIAAYRPPCMVGVA
jgi:hypothetical protein